MLKREPKDGIKTGTCLVAASGEQVKAYGLVAVPNATQHAVIQVDDIWIDAPVPGYEQWVIASR
jgi:hypothetical protein